MISDNGLMCFSLLQLSESPLPHCDLCPVYPPILSLSLNPLHILSSPSASLDSLAIIRSIFLHFISYLTLSLCTFLFWKTLTLIKSHLLCACTWTGWMFLEKHADWFPLLPLSRTRTRVPKNAREPRRCALLLTIMSNYIHFFFPSFLCWPLPFIHSFKKF